MNAKEKAIVAAQLKSLADNMGLEILSLPIYTFAWTHGMPAAYTDNRGLWIGNLVFDNPEDLPEYVAHEIWHHVLRNHDKEFHLEHHRLNTATDYRINYLNNKLFGYDARKAAIPGIYSKKLGRIKSIIEIYRRIGGTFDAHCRLSHNSHPLLLRQAEILRRRFKKYIDDHPRDYFIMDQVDSDRYYEFLGTTTTSLSMSALTFIDLDRTLKGIWAHVCLEKAIAPNIEREYLLPGEVLTYAFPAARFRTDYQDKPAEVIVMAMLYLNYVDKDAVFIRERVTKTRTNIARLEMKLRDRRWKFDRVAIKKRIKELTARLNYLEALTPLPELLTQYFPEFKVIKKAPVKMSTMKDDLAEAQRSKEYFDNVRAPRLYKDEIVRRLRSTASRARRQTDYTFETMGSLNQLLKDFGQAPI